MVEVVLSVLLSFALSKAQYTILVLISEPEDFFEFSKAPGIKHSEPGGLELRPTDLAVAVKVHPG